MKLSEWKCIAMNKKKENQKFNQHGKESEREGLTKGKVDSRLRHLETN